MDKQGKLHVGKPYIEKVAALEEATGKSDSEIVRSLVDQIHYQVRRGGRTIPLEAIGIDPDIVRQKLTQND